MTNYNLADFKQWLKENKKEEAISYGFWKEGKLDEKFLRQFEANWNSLSSRTIREWMAELDQRERERERVKSTHKSNMFYEKFEKLEKKISESETGNSLFSWSDIFNVFGCDDCRDYFLDNCKVIELIWDRSEDQKGEYVEIQNVLLSLFEVLEKTAYETNLIGENDYLEWHNTVYHLLNEMLPKKSEFIKIKKEKRELTNKLSTSEYNLNNLGQQLDSLKSELTKKEQELSELRDKLADKENKSADLGQQLTASAVSSGLLTQQVENLTTQLSASQQKEQATKLELELKNSLLTSQENELKNKDNKISQQEEEIKRYHNILCKAEENLKKAQDIISQKIELITQLEREKESIQNELDLTQENINNLEQTLFQENQSKQERIQVLETRINELENKDDNSTELANLKKELLTEKAKNSQHQQQINHLKSELTQTKAKEQQLAEQIKKLGTKATPTKEIQEPTSFWDTIKTPLFWIGGGIIAILAFGWLISKTKEQ